MEEQRTPEEELNYAVEQAKKLFLATFGSLDSTIVVCAPGRVNLIGEHTDYNDGFVMPFAIKNTTVFVGRKSIEATQPTYLVSALKPDQVEEFSINGTLKSGEEKWFKYVQGVIYYYLDDIEKATGSKEISFQAAVFSTVPLGGGLSSSASLEIATATFLETLYGIKRVDGVTKALRGVESEHNFAHVPCGIMDQTIVALGKKDHALFLDCKDKSFEHVPLPSEADYAFLIVNSNAPHELTGGEYKERVDQCALGCKILNVDSLRSATLSLIETKFGANKTESIEEVMKLSQQEIETVKKRCVHVVGENERVEIARKCLKEGNFVGLGKAMYDSHDSLSKLYEVSTEELDLLVAIARKQPGVLGSRMTGGGFGGCTVSLVEKKEIEKVKTFVVEEYKKATGKDCSVIVTPACDGSRSLE
eukprot:maker-scaffold_52-snap-gene-1.9-mRNA-1 protein AED:0.02 eAED:0.02 QI:140/1/1/1/1/1/3/248/418